MVTSLELPTSRPVEPTSLRRPALFPRFGERIEAAAIDARALLQAVERHGVVLLSGEAGEHLAAFQTERAVEREPLPEVSGLWHFVGGYRDDAPAFTAVTGGPDGVLLSFSHAGLAYDSLDPALQRYVNTLSVIRYVDTIGALTRALPDFAERTAALQQLPASVTPIVRRHPSTDRAVLAVDEAFTNYIAKAERIFSHNLLGVLFEHLRAPEVTGALALAPGDTVLWDNRLIQVRAATEKLPLRLIDAGDHA